MPPHPQSAQELEQQAEACIQQGRLAEAEELYRSLIASGSDRPSVYGNLAALYGMAGRQRDMVALLQKALELNPQFPEALYNLGLAYSGLGDKQAAIKAYQEAISLRPNYPEAHYNLGNALQEQGKFKEAAEAYGNALTHRPNHPETHFNLGIARKNLSDLDGAVAAYRQALNLRANYPDAHYNLANAYLELGELDSAVEAYTASLRLKADHPDAQANLGTAFLELGQLKEAIQAFNNALQLKPNDPSAHTNLGHALQERGELEQAIASYRQALQLKPDDPSALSNLGCALQEHGELEAALAAYEQALKLDPSHPDANNNRGTALQKQGELEGAIAAYNSALQRKPNHSQALYNLGNALQEQGHLDAAIASYQRALDCDAKRSQVHRNLSMTLLLAGDYKRGWELYESRLDRASKEGVLHAWPPCPRWDGTPLAAGEKLLLVSEQGLGDTLQFMRYANHLRQEHALQVTLCADAKLHGLVRTSGIDPNPITPEEAMGIGEGYWVPLLSVPRHLGVCPAKPLVTEAYIHPPEALISKWRDVFANEKRPLVAINWQGNPDHETTNSKGRSLPLETFAPIAERCAATLVSLQKGWGAEQLDNCSFKQSFTRSQSLVSEAWDFEETAAILANCDLVITSDTSLAHLAGGMGRPTWLLLKKVPEWRWGMEGSHSFWYPSIRLFRQSQRGDWPEVLERAAAALNAFMAPQAASASSASLEIMLPASLGELVDKLTILEIKREHFLPVAPIEAKRNVENEYQRLKEILEALPVSINPGLISRLKEVNAGLWQIEDEIRVKENHKDFGEAFIRLARSVYQQNDRRAAIKREINSLYGSAIVEEKLYAPY